MKRTILSTIIIATLFLTACEDKDDEMPDGMLNLNINGLMELGSDEMYEGWIIVAGTPKSTGTFSVDAMGALSKTSFTVNATDLAAATDFVLSIEPSPDSDPAPSAIKILGGSFSGSDASVTAAHGAALGDAFDMISGKYILATPTTATTEDELSGIWFLDLASGMPAVGLDLPTLPSGWKYEGWAVIDGIPVTSGTFSMVDMEDDSAPFSSTGMGPMFPGEDYVMNAPGGLTFPTDLSESTLVISIEPSPDNSPDPFVFKPLVAPVMAMAEDHKTYDMSDNVSASFPNGTAKR